MRIAAVLLAVSATLAAGRIVSAHGVRVTIPASWSRVQATPSALVDPKTLLVVGTVGVRMDLTSECQIAAYRIPPGGAVVVVVGWRKSYGGRPGRAPLRALRRV